jgi:glutaconate CoA-transferase, subunit A
MNTPGLRAYADLRKSLADRNRGLHEKVTSLENAASLIADNQLVGIGGSMMSRTPMAMIWQLIRSGRKNLICSRPIVTSEGDLLLASGLSKHIITSWFSQGIMWGVSKVMRRFIESGAAQYDEWSHLAIGMRLQAGAMGVPFMPIRSMQGSDVQKSRPEVKDIDCPFTGEKLLLVPALNPDVAVIHVQSCDAYGNARIDGLQFMDVELAMAADKVILTTERIVSNNQIRRCPDQTKIPFFCVDAVVEVPFGSAPHECYGLYEPLMGHMQHYVKLANSESAEDLRGYIDDYIHAPGSWTDYLELIGLGELLEAARLGRLSKND